MRAPERQWIFPVRNYDLAATLTSGQAFRWRHRDGAWEGVIGRRWVKLQSRKDGILAETALPVADWDWLAHYLQVEVDLNAVLSSFPNDEPMRASIRACRGLRLLRQDPWECLASFILSSTKQIVQIQQIASTLCERFGVSVPVPADHEPAYAFPAAERLAAVTESELRACKMGFRAPYLLASARWLAGQDKALDDLRHLTASEARQELLKLPGVGPKIANCVLLFAYGFQDAFPVDVWVMKALRQLYFPKRRPSPARVQRFISEHFGAHAGYAQQYLFHYARQHARQRKQTRLEPSICH